MRRIAYVIAYILLTFHLSLSSLATQSGPVSKEELEKEVRMAVNTWCEATEYKPCHENLVKKYKSLGAAAAPIMIRLYEAESDLRWRILADLGYVSGEEAFAFLTSQVRSQKNDQLLGYAATGLARTQDNRAFHDLANLLNHRNPSVRSTATAALGHLKDERALPLLERANQSDPDAEVRLTAFKNLTLMKLAKLSPEERFDLLTRGLRAAEGDSDTEKLKWFILRIGEGKYPDSLKVISRYLTHKDIQVRHEAINAFAALGDPRAITLLEKILPSDPSEQVRDHAEKTVRYLKTAREKK